MKRSGIFVVMCVSFFLGSNGFIGATNSAATTTIFTENQIILALNAHVASRTLKDGTLKLMVSHNNAKQQFQLAYERVHLPVTQIDAQTYFACTNLRDMNQNETIYDVDFWLTVKDGKLVVDSKRTEIHKINGKKLFDYNADGSKIPVPLS